METGRKKSRRRSEGNKENRVVSFVAFVNAVKRPQPTGLADPTA